MSYISDQQTIVKKFLTNNPRSTMRDIQGPWAPPPGTAEKEFYEKVLKPMVDNKEIVEYPPVPHIYDTRNLSPEDIAMQKLREKRFSLPENPAEVETE